MIEAGSVSHSYVPYAIALPETTNLTREATAINSAAAALATFLAAKNASSGAFVNLFDSSKNTLGVIDTGNPGTADGQYNPQFSINTVYIVGSPYVISNLDIGYANAGFTTLFLAADGVTVLESRPGLAYPQGTPIPTNAASTYMKFFSLTTQMTASASHLPMIVSGSVLPSVNVPFSQPFNPWQGKRGFIAGDSICGYQNGAWPKKLAAVLGLQQTIGNPGAYPEFTAFGTSRGAYASGTTYAANDLVYFTDGIYYLSLVASNTGNAPATSPAKWTVWVYTSDVISFPGHPVEDCFLSLDGNVAANPGGPTTTQQLTAALQNKDFIILAAGTNNYQQALGSFTDAPVDGNSATNASSPGAPTFYAALWFKLNLVDAAILATGRTIVPCFSTPYHNSRGTSAALLAQINAIHAVCAERGWVVIDNYSNLAINSNNWPRTLIHESDGAGGMMYLHPTTPAGTDLLGNYHARVLIANAQV